MATSVQFSGMASGGFVLKSVRDVTLRESATETFSVQNEGDFCVIEGFISQSGYYYTVNRIDDIFVANPERTNEKLSIIFGKNIEILMGVNDIPCRIYEYGPAE